MLADVVINSAHRLAGAGGRTGKGEFAVGDLTLVQSEWSVAEYNETAIGEMAGFVFVEIEDHFFVGKGILADFHG